MPKRARGCKKGSGTRRHPQDHPLTTPDAEKRKEPKRRPGRVLQSVEEAARIRLAYESWLKKEGQDAILPVKIPLSPACTRNHLREIREHYNNKKLLRVSSVFQGNFALMTRMHFATYYYSAKRSRNIPSLLLPPSAAVPKSPGTTPGNTSHVATTTSNEETLHAATRGSSRGTSPSPTQPSRSQSRSQSRSHPHPPAHDRGRGNQVTDMVRYLKTSLASRNKGHGQGGTTTRGTSTTSSPVTKRGAAPRGKKRQRDGTARGTNTNTNANPTQHNDVPVRRSSRLRNKHGNKHGNKDGKCSTNTNTHGAHASSPASPPSVSSHTVAPSVRREQQENVEARDYDHTFILVTAKGRDPYLTALYDNWRALFPVFFNTRCRFLCVAGADLKGDTDAARQARDPHTYLLLTGFDIMRRVFDDPRYNIILMQTEQLMGTSDQDKKVARLLECAADRAAMVLDWNPAHVDMMRNANISNPRLFPTLWGLHSTPAPARPLATPQALHAVTYDILMFTPKQTERQSFTPRQKAFSDRLKSVGKHHKLRVFVGAASAMKRQLLLRHAKVMVLPHALVDDTGLPLYELTVMAGSVNPGLVMLTESCTVPTVVQHPRTAATPQLHWGDAMVCTENVIDMAVQLCSRSPRARRLLLRYQDHARDFWKGARQLDTLGVLALNGAVPVHM